MARAHVEVISGPQAGTTYDFDDRVTLGRRPENMLTLRDEHMSRFHALIERRAQRWVLEDLSGRGRTVVDGHPVQGAIDLQDHARITMGRTTLRFRIVAGEDSALETQTFSVVPAYTPTRGTATPLPMVEEMAPDGLRLLPPHPGDLAENLSATDLHHVRRAGQHLNTLLSAHAIISDEIDVEKLFERILDALFETYPAHRAVILTAEGEQLTIRASRLGPGTQPEQEPTVSSTIAYRAFRDRVGVLTLDAALDRRFDPRESIVDQDIRSAICAPLLHRDEALGVIYLDTLGVRSAFSDDDLRLLHGIAAAAAAALKNATLIRRLKETAMDTVFRLALAAEHRDQETGFHIHRMSEYAATLARGLGLSEAYAETMRLAAPMHDVGKIGIPDAILKKPGRLTADEYEVMKQHTIKGGEILAGAQSELLQMAQSIALTHHEKFDGTGYPKGLKEKQIPLEGRIVAVADVFDAVLSKRCYKPAFALEKGIDVLEQGKGRHFDPDVVDAFLSVQDEILRIRDRYREMETESQDSTGPMSRVLLQGPLTGL